MTLGRPPSRFEATCRRLRADLDAGLLGADGLLPGERDLSRRLAVSRTTVRRVLAALVEEGRLAHRQGVGTFVPTQAREPAASAAPAPRVDAPEGPAGFSETMRRRGLATTTQVLSHAVIEPSPEEAMVLGCAPRETIVRLRRLRFVDGEPVRVEDNVLPAPFAVGLERLEGSLHAALAMGGVSPARALQRLTVGIARPHEASHLGIAPGSPTVIIRRMDYLADGRCCLFTAAAMRADRFDIVLELGVSAAASVA